MRVVALSGVFLVGCFDPHPPAGRPCGDRAPRCPSGLVCSPATSTCEREAQPLIDASLIDVPVDTPTVPCLADNFDDGTATDWMITEGSWAIAPLGGPDGSPALRAMTPGAAAVTHPMIAGVKTAKIGVDFRMEGAVSGDFFVRFYAPPWIADPPNGKRYTMSMFVDGGDDPDDRISITQPPAAAVELTSRPTSVKVLTWHHLDVTFGAGNAFRIDLDGAPYLEVTSDDKLSAPYDVAFRFWQPGTIDNVVVECTH